MMIWKKALVIFTMLGQIVVGTTVAALWVFRDQAWTVPINDWLHSPGGQRFAASIGIYLTLFAVVTLTAVLTQAAPGKTAIRAECQAIEHHLRAALISLIHNPVVKLKLRHRQTAADVIINGERRTQTDPRLLNAVIQQAVQNELRQNYSLAVNKLRVHLNGEITEER